MDEYITKRPRLKDYGLTKEYVDNLIKDKNAYVEKVQNSFDLTKHPFLNFIVNCIFYLLALSFAAVIILGPIAIIERGFNIRYFIIGIVIVFAYFIMINYVMPVNRTIDGIMRSYPRKDEWDVYQHYIDDTKKYNEWLRSKQMDFWKSLDGFTFEKEMQKLFAAQGYDSSLTNAGADGGVDIVLKKGGKTIAVQCKAHKTKISEGIARDLYGVLFAHNYDSGILATVNGASKKTIEFCNSLRDKPIKIIDVKDIIEMQESLQSRSRE